MKKRLQHKIYNYIAVFNPAKEGGFNVSFPDFPDCVTFGRTYKETKKKAKEVLELWLEELQARREYIPVNTPRPITV